MQQVFITYCSKASQHTADRIQGALEASPGVRVTCTGQADSSATADGIDQAVRASDALLVIVDEHWSLGQDDSRDDAAHVAIRRALAEEIDIVPLLVGGASMPTADTLPDDISDFADYSPHTLDTESWAEDIDDLLSELQQTLPVPAGPVQQRSPQQMLIAAGLLGLLFVLGGFLLVSRVWLAEPSAFIGSWVAQVDYGRSVVREERFDFRATGGDISGSATYLGSRRIIEGAVQDGERVSFYTRSHENLGSERRELRHDYVAIADGDTIRFVLRSSGGFDERGEVEFEAQRMP